MVKTYIKERSRWIGLLIGQQPLLLLVVFVDPTIPFSSVLYINFLSFLTFIGFFLFFYHKETGFYRQLMEREPSLDTSTLDEAESPFESIVKKSLEEQINRYKQEISHNRIELEQEKDELLSWIHEVKTPLTAMHLMIDRLEGDKIKAQLTYEWLRIHLLLDQQLHQKRIPFMKNDLYIEQTALEPLIFHEIRSLQSWCLQKGIGFDVALSEAFVLSDAKWLAFILRQLFTNAIKYSDSGDIVIHSFRKEDRTVLEVTDFGRGISTQDLSRIFEKGFTSTDSAQHQGSGATGMGLYLTDKAASSLLIQINVSSAIGKGTTFTLTFPKRNEFNKITGM